ncbi:MAG: hypothetical protein ABR581_03235 [Thermoleophilaceae bacterium]
MRRFRRARRDETADDSGDDRRSRLRAAPRGALALVATLVDLITAAVAVVILIGIAFVVLKANRHNDIVSTVHDVAKWLVGPFDGMFTPKDRKLGVAINWGIALVVYVIVGRFIASLVRRALPRSG